MMSNEVATAISDLTTSVTRVDNTQEVWNRDERKKNFTMEEVNQLKVDETWNGKEDVIDGDNDNGGGNRDRGERDVSKQWEKYADERELWFTSNENAQSRKKKEMRIISQEDEPLNLKVEQQTEQVSQCWNVNSLKINKIWSIDNILNESAHAQSCKKKKMKITSQEISPLKLRIKQPEQINQSWNEEKMKNDSVSSPKIMIKQEQDSQSENERKMNSGDQEVSQLYENRCSYSCNLCYFNSQAWFTMYRHYRKAHYNMYNPIFHNAYGLVSVIVHHECNECKKILLCDTTIIRLHIRAHGMSVEKYKQQTNGFAFFKTLLKRRFQVDEEPLTTTNLFFPWLFCSDQLK